ncbi:MAG: HupE/UreJ family protein [Burkholderiaceae bacterium]
MPIKHHSAAITAATDPPPAIGFGRAALLALCLAPMLAQAHSDTGSVGGLLSGFLHPLTGVDHIVAMVAVGIWGALLGAPAMWLLPVVFPIVMAFGGALGVLGVPLPGVESAIGLSGLALGILIVLAARPPLWVAALTVGFFAIFHGHAHGTELPQAANAVTYAVGFVVATGLLHLAGISLGLLVRWPWGRVAVRACGGVIAATGAGFLFGFL